MTEADAGRVFDRCKRRDPTKDDRFLEFPNQALHPMMPLLETPAMVNVFQTEDQRQYLFMELAKVDPGHYVAWGGLRIMNHEEARQEGRDFVVQSLRSFPERNGRNKRGRPKLSSFRPMKHELVVVRQLSGDLLEVIPCHRGERQHHRVIELRTTLPIDTSAEQFISALNCAFDRGRGASVTNRPS